MQLPRRRSLPALPARLPRALPSLPARPRLADLAVLAAFIRDRLSEVGDSLAPLLARRDVRTEVEAQAATVIVAAAAPFAPTSFARARLLRQMHASGLLSDRETEQVEHLFGA